MKAVAYIRVSTKEQDENNQRQAILEFAKKKNIEILGWFIDKGVSGTRKFREREGAQTLMNYIKTNKVDAIIVFAIDRLGRNMEDTVNTIKELEMQGVRVISVKEDFLQTMNPEIRKLILSILSWFAEFERNRIRERQLAAWEAGKQKGRPPKLTDATLKKYLKKYPDLTIRSLWKIMKADGIDISYDWLRKRIKRIRVVEE
ncbi:recombinase family protein [Pyrococcus horikoshii]|uniref:Resolvase/invertase-type recombinase catalytic domain-containing protein n=2 Tax=Pyrococcus horikoshii TaxID=53953 RepID=O58922_PYRHO|nr:recombinase family protein [Pyrococcus horikoshii]BAA30274.1 201aa long hypothetical protein [Pyrococcus horikoshii OT3]HII61791.1 recombinase family protein [Pyrococcus horikoshii]